MHWSIFILAAVAVCLAVWWMYVPPEPVRVKKNRKLVSEFVGEEPDEKTEEVKKSIKKVPEKDRTPEDSYTLFLVNYWYDKDAQESQKSAKEVVEKIVQNPDPQDDWIADRMQRVLIDDISLQKREEKLLEKQKTTKAKKKSKRGAVELHKKAKQWKSDSQNVHDSAVNSDLKKQFRKIRKENGADSAELSIAFNMAREWMLRTSPTKESRKSIEVTLKRLADGSKAITVGAGILERDVLSELWLRSTLPKNTNNTTAIREALRQAVEDCVENGKLVCSTGRVARLMSSLAFVDADKKMGKVKSKEILQNEFVDTCAGIVRNIRNRLSDKEKAAYDKGESSAEHIVKIMQSEMEKAAETYRGKIDDTRLERVLEECKSAA